MNCHDIDSILDNGGTEQLSAAERSRVDTHLATCERCTAAWSVHDALVRQRVPELPPGLLESTRKLVARRARREQTRGSVRRWVSIGGVAAAASLVLAVLIFGVVGTRPGETARLAFRNELPEFVLPGLAGQPLSIRSWPGRPLVINFWATWCAPCVREIPLLKDFQIQHPSMQVVGIAVDNVDAVKTFDADMQFNYPIMIGGAEAVEAAAAFGVEVLAMPFTIFAAADGRLIGVHRGEIHAEELESFVAVVSDLEAQRIDIETARARLAEVP